MSDSEEDVGVERQVKISLVGESAAGKSMLCARYVGLSWSGVAAPTQGAEVLLGECTVRPARPPVPIKFCDVAGGAGATSMLPNYLYASHIIILVYDVTNLSSFERLGYWLEMVRSIFVNEEAQPLLAMFGNKCDLEHQRAIRLSSAQTYAKENFLNSFTGSARTGENVSASITALVSQILGIPVSRSIFNSTIVKAELAQHIRNPIVEKKNKINNNLQSVNFSRSTKKNKKAHANQDDVDEENNEVTKKRGKKNIRKIKMKASSSAVCILQ